MTRTTTTTAAANTGAKKFGALWLVVMMALLAPLAACTPTPPTPPAPPPPPATADVEVTVTDIDGAPFTGVTVTADGQSAATDSAGIAVLTGLQPGATTIIIEAGPRATVARDEVLAAGANSFTYVVHQPYQALGLTSLARLRFKLTQVYGDAAETYAEAAVDRETASAHWFFGDGELVVLEGELAYLKHEGYWSPIEGYIAEAMAEIYAMLAEEYAASLAASLDQLTAEDVQATLLRTASANGYDCRVYEVVYSLPDQPISYTAYVIASGPDAGRVTRFEYRFDGDALFVTDIWDFDGDFEIEAPY